MKHTTSTENAQPPPVIPFPLQHGIAHQRAVQAVEERDGALLDSDLDYFEQLAVYRAFQGKS